MVKTVIWAIKIKGLPDSFFVAKSLSSSLIFVFSLPHSHAACVLSLPMTLFQTISPSSLWTSSFSFFPKINIFTSPPPSCFYSSSIHYFLNTPRTFSTPSSLLLTPPSTTASTYHPLTQASSRVGFIIRPATSTGLGPEQRSWAARTQISPPKSGTGAPLFPGLQLEERRLEREGGADWDTRDSKSRF